MKRRLHPIAGAVAIATISVFWAATVGSELFGTEDQVRAVKLFIPWGFLILIPALAATGAIGFSLAGGRRGGMIDAKRRRMPVIAANGILVLAPSALFLAWKAEAGAFDAPFYAVQVLELAAGAINLALLSLNFRGGLALTRRRRRAAT